MLRTNRQTDKQTDSKILPTPTDIVDMGKNVKNTIRVQGPPADSSIVPYRHVSAVSTSSTRRHLRSAANTVREVSTLCSEKNTHLCF